jgi:uncharacterized repeat protein (TIGR03803 family)
MARNAVAVAPLLFTVIASALLSPAFAADPVALTVEHAFNGGADGLFPNKGALVLDGGQLYGTTQNGGSGSFGVLYSLSRTGAELIRHSFQLTTEGVGPDAGVVRDAAGNLYAALNAHSPAAPRGLIVKLSPTGVLHVLHVFKTDGTEGFIIDNGLTVGIDGKLYGVSASGGNRNCGTFFSLKTNGANFQAHDLLPGDTGACNPHISVTQGPDGNFYGLADYALNGIGAGSGSLYRATPGGIVTTLYPFLDNNQEPPTGVPVSDASGNLYFFGGIRNGSMAGRVYEYSAGGVLSVLHQFTITDGAPGPYSSRLLLHTDGRLYGTTSDGGTGGNGNVFSLGLDGSFAVLHNFPADLSEGANPEAPPAAAIDGSLWGTTRVGGLAFRLTPPTATLSVTPASIPSGQSAKIRWSSKNTTDCVLTDPAVGAIAEPVSGSRSVSPGVGVSSYSLTCHGAGSVAHAVNLTVN